MSVKVSAWVWSIEQANPVDRLVLLAIADCATDDGTKAWPSMTTIAAKACVTRRGAQIAVHRLVLAGLLKVTSGGGRARCNSYTVLMNCERRTLIKPVKSEPETVNDVRSELDSANTKTQTANVTTQTANVGSPRTSLTRPQPNQTRANGWTNDLQEALEDFYSCPYPMNMVLETKRLITEGIDTSKIHSPVKYVMAAVRKDPDRFKVYPKPEWLPIVDVGRTM
jgi:hypothetical protein